MQLNSKNTSQVKHNDSSDELYRDHGGTCLGICGPEFALIAADTRSSDGYEILSRNQSKITQLNKSCYLGSAGMISDRLELVSTLKQSMNRFEFESNREMNITELAQLLSNTLYRKRFFPFYTFNLLIGFNEVPVGKSIDGLPEGTLEGGVLYNYDAVGSYQKCACYCTGSGSEMGTVILDSYVKAVGQTQTTLSQEKALEITKRTFEAIAERDIKTGDKVEVYLVTKGKTESFNFPLRND